MWSGGRRALQDGEETDCTLQSEISLISRITDSKLNEMDWKNILWNIGKDKNPFIINNTHERGGAILL